MQLITNLGLALCLAVLYQRPQSPHARAQQHVAALQNRAPASASHPGLAGHQYYLRHLDHALSGDPEEPLSTWDRAVKTLSDWAAAHP